MRIKVELHPDVVAWLHQHRHDQRLIDLFYRRLHALCDEPRTLIANSEAVSDPSLSRYMLRFFRFGENKDYVAVFKPDVGRSRIRVLGCRGRRPVRRPGFGADAPEEPP
ncbi:MAG: hypothetical protein V2A79_15985 [Planctomycetota bacterium]